MLCVDPKKGVFCSELRLKINTNDINEKKKSTSNTYDMLPVHSTCYIKKKGHFGGINRRNRSVWSSVQYLKSPPTKVGMLI